MRTFTNEPSLKSTVTNGPFVQIVRVYVGVIVHLSSSVGVAVWNKSVLQFVIACYKWTICKDFYKWTICKALLQSGPFVQIGMLCMGAIFNPWSIDCFSLGNKSVL